MRVFTERNARRDRAASIPLSTVAGEQRFFLVSDELEKIKKTVGKLYILFRCFTFKLQTSRTLIYI